MDFITPISEARAHLPEVVDSLRKSKKRCVITRQGKPVAVMVSPEEFETMEIMADEELLKSLIRAEQDVKAGRLYKTKDVFDV